MKQRLSKQELVLVAGALAIGCFLRWTQTHALAVEHFDEGIYSSVIWYERVSDDPYPSRHLYAPPLLPAAIEISHGFVSLDLAPFLPGLLAGSLSILAIWVFTRSCFGMAAGIAAVVIVAFSDFHIVFSRMALTDVPVLLWITLSVWLGIAGIDRSSPRTMILSGLVCGLAWWTKYSGWLPVAIVASGSGLWWITGGRQLCSLGRLLLLNLTMAAAAVVIWLPWLWTLQDSGGYAAVSANHAAYFSGLVRWRDNLTSQVTWYTELDSWLTAVAIGLGIFFAGGHRWFAARRSTWNSVAQVGSGVRPVLLLRFVTAAVLLPIITLSTGSFGVLVSIGAGGLAGVFLWPVLSVLKESTARLRNGKAGRLQTGDCVEDFTAAPALSPRLGACTVTAWFGGMLLMTPMYAPFPRLFLPFVATLWIAAAAGIGWWIEAGLNVARRTALGESVSKRRGLQAVVSGLMIVALVVVAAAGLQQNRRPIIHDSRAGLKEASRELALLCEADAAEHRPELLPEEAPGYVAYAFGEPSVLFHLNALGVTAVPVQVVGFRSAAFRGQDLPTYLIFGPNALRTPDFMYNWVDEEYRFEHVGNVSFKPSSIVLFNLFDPQWIMQHPDEVRQQKLEIWRLK